MAFGITSYLCFLLLNLKHNYTMQHVHLQRKCVNTVRHCMLLQDTVLMQAYKYDGKMVQYILLPGDQRVGLQLSDF